jgi:uncharacterized protein (TIGR02594 family)
MHQAKTRAMLAFCAVVLSLLAVSFSSSPTWARSARHMDSAHHHAHGRHHHAERSVHRRASRHVRAAHFHHRGRASHAYGGRSQAQASASEQSAFALSGSTGGSGSYGGSSSGIIAEARRWIGGNPTGRRSLWCGRFMNFVLQRTGHRGTGSDLARSFAHYGSRLSGPQVGAIAVMARHGGGHVGVVSGIDAKGNPIIISGNHGHRVAEATYSRGRIYAYVMPQG